MRPRRTDTRTALASPRLLAWACLIAAAALTAMAALDALGVEWRGPLTDLFGY